MQFHPKFDKAKKSSVNFGLSHSIAFNQSYLRNYLRNLKLIKNPILTTKAGILKIVLMLCVSHILFALSLY